MQILIAHPTRSAVNNEILIPPPAFPPTRVSKAFLVESGGEKKKEEADEGEKKGDDVSVRTNNSPWQQVGIYDASLFFFSYNSLLWLFFLNTRYKNNTSCFYFEN